MSEEEFEIKLVWEELIRRNEVTKELCHSILCDSLIKGEAKLLVADYLKANNPTIEDWIVMSRESLPDEIRMPAQDQLMKRKEELSASELAEIVAFTTESFVEKLWLLFLQKKPGVKDLLLILSQEKRGSYVEDNAQEKAATLLLEREKELTEEDLQVIHKTSGIQYKLTQRAKEILEQREQQKKRQLLEQKTTEELVALLTIHLP